MTTNLPAKLGHSLPMQTMADIATAGNLLAQSGMFGIENAAAGFVVVATCHQQGISLMEFHRSYHIVQRRPSMRADAMLAEFRKHGGRYTIVENSTTKAAAEFEFEGQTVTFSYTMEDAKRTGDCFEKDGKTVKHTWQKRPDDMLWARMASRAVRRLCPEINAGPYPPEEVADFAELRGAGPITTDEAAQRARVVVPDEIAELGKAALAVDYTRCPIGDETVKGRPWSDIDDATLREALLIDDPEMTHTHKAAIKYEIDERQEEQQS